MSYAPIILFIYNRPNHTMRTLEALSSNTLAQESDLFIYADGPKENATEEQRERIRQTREVARSRQWCRTVTLIESDTNKGLAASIIAGVTETVNKYGRVIVLEDDLITSPYFLEYMNEALNVYKDTEKVACIHGYVEPHEKPLPETFFMKGADCWGWGTWKRAWDKFNPNGQELLDEIHRRNCERDFNFGNAYPYVRMLEDQIAGKNDSWAIRWLASAYLCDMYCLYPNETLVLNTGFDGSGTHCGSMALGERKLTDHKVNVARQEPEQCADAWNEYRKYYKKQYSVSTFTRMMRGVKNRLRLFR